MLGINGSRAEVWRWWESRRFRFNRDVILTGVASWILVAVAGSAAVPAGDDFVEPLVLFLAPPVYLILANVCYTAGPAVDFLWFRGAPREHLFRAGYWASLLLAAAPGVWAVAYFSFSRLSRW